MRLARPVMMPQLGALARRDSMPQLVDSRSPPDSMPQLGMRLSLATFDAATRWALAHHLIPVPQLRMLTRSPRDSMPQLVERPRSPRIRCAAR
ncbi:hypothetical protein AVEN_106699-1 [Araneus ventricosus]|uniref:Uncharacterized protein n=1 Tax=Araneus ventricosus TaxID=182803 RepID=A0A4Y2F314_ARAVE|nr:hypothetical protein AVEN_106699-1 [Araneus ventricosus]